LTDRVGWPDERPGPDFDRENTDGDEREWSDTKEVFPSTWRSGDWWQAFALHWFKLKDKICSQLRRPDEKLLKEPFLIPLLYIF
jgi:hypothetical protein